MTALRAQSSGLKHEPNRKYRANTPTNGPLAAESQNGAESASWVGQGWPRLVGITSPFRSRPRTCIGNIQLGEADIHYTGALVEDRVLRHPGAAARRGVVGRPSSSWTCGRIIAAFSAASLAIICCHGVYFGRNHHRLRRAALSYISGPQRKCHPK